MFISSTNKDSFLRDEGVFSFLLCIPLFILLARASNMMLNRGERVSILVLFLTWVGILLKFHDRFWGNNPVFLGIHVMSKCWELLNIFCLSFAKFQMIFFTCLISKTIEILIELFLSFYNKPYFIKVCLILYIVLDSISSRDFCVNTERYVYNFFHTLPVQFWYQGYVKLKK